MMIDSIKQYKDNNVLSSEQILNFCLDNRDNIGVHKALDVVAITIKTEKDYHYNHLNS
jgi:hypothetical protein